jgi:hypothetical protein
MWSLSPEFRPGIQGFIISAPSLARKSNRNSLAVPITCTLSRVLVIAACPYREPGRRQHQVNRSGQECPLHTVIPGAIGVAADSSHKTRWMGTVGVDCVGWIKGLRYFHHLVVPLRCYQFGGPPFAMKPRKDGAPSGLIVSARSKARIRTTSKSRSTAADRSVRSTPAEHCSFASSG